MRPVEDLLNALEVYYTVNEPMVYNPAQRRMLISRYGFFSQEFITKLYQEIVAVHEARFRTLPDAAVFSRVMQSMGDPRTYEQQQKALPMPEFDMQTYLDKHDKAVEEGAEKERNRVRMKRHRTVAEEWWLETVEYGRWLPMPKNWEAGDPFPPEGITIKDGTNAKTGLPLHHGKRVTMPSRG